MKYLQKTLQEALMIWIILTGEIIIASVLYASLSVVGVPENVSLLIALATLLGLFVLVELIKSGILFHWTLTDNMSHSQTTKIPDFSDTRYKDSQPETIEEGLTRLLASIGAFVTFTGLTVYYAWQIVLGMPFLATVIGITTGIVIALLEILSVYWLAVGMHSRIRRLMVMRKNQ